MTTFTKKPRTLRVDDYWCVLAPMCPKCRRADKTEIDDMIHLSFTCTRCNHPLTLEETIDGQKEVEQ